MISSSSGVVHNLLHNTPEVFHDASFDWRAFIISNVSHIVMDTAALRDVKVATLGRDHGGLSGAMLRLLLTYDGGIDDDDDTSDVREERCCHRRTSQLIVKTTCVDEASRNLSKNLALYREASFLRAIMAPNISNNNNDNNNKCITPRRPLYDTLRRYSPQLLAHIPRIYYANYDYASNNNTDTSGVKLILCEDLMLRNGVQSGWFFGLHSVLNHSMSIQELNYKLAAKGWKISINNDQNNNNDNNIISGNNLIPVSAVDIMSRAVELAADLHGAMWENENIFKLIDYIDNTNNTDNNTNNFDIDAIRNLRGIGWLSHNNNPSSRQLFESHKDMAVAGWTNFINRIEEHNNNKTKKSETGNNSSNNNNSYSVFMLPAMVQRLCEICTHNTAIQGYDEYCEALRRRHFTLVHGDFHPGNMMVVKSDKKEQQQQCFDLMLLDWEVVGIGSGPQDIGQYIISHSNPEQMNAAMTIVVPAYIKRLQDHLANNNQRVTDEEIRSEVIYGGLGRWAWLLCVMGAMPNISLYPMMLYFVTQVENYMGYCGHTVESFQDNDNLRKLTFRL